MRRFLKSWYRACRLFARHVAAERVKDSALVEVLLELNVLASTGPLWLQP
jgi:hypothetical protein